MIELEVHCPHPEIADQCRYLWDSLQTKQSPIQELRNLSYAAQSLMVTPAGWHASKLAAHFPQRQAAQIEGHMYYAGSRHGVWPHHDADSPSMTYLLVIRNEGFALQTSRLMEFSRSQPAGTILALRADCLHWLTPFGETPADWLAVGFDAKPPRLSEFQLRKIFRQFLTEQIDLLNPTK